MDTRTKVIFAIAGLSAAFIGPKYVGHHVDRFLQEHGWRGLDNAIINTPILAQLLDKDGYNPKTMYVKKNNQSAWDRINGVKFENEICILNTGDRIVALKEDGPWTKIILGNGKIGYVYTNSLSPEKQKVRYSTDKIQPKGLLDPNNQKDNNKPKNTSNLSQPLKDAVSKAGLNLTAFAKTYENVKREAQANRYTAKTSFTPS